MPDTKRVNMENLKRKRGALKAKLTTFTELLNEVEELLGQEQPDERDKRAYSLTVLLQKIAS